MTIILEEKHEKIFKNMVEHRVNLKILLESFQNLKFPKIDI